MLSFLFGLLLSAFIVVKSVVLVVLFINSQSCSPYWIFILNTYLFSKPNLSEIISAKTNHLKLQNCGGLSIYGLVTKSDNKRKPSTSDYNIAFDNLFGKYTKKKV